jgi:hypothetical protein
MDGTLTWPEEEEPKNNPLCIPLTTVKKQTSTALSKCTPCPNAFVQMPRAPPISNLQTQEEMHTGLVTTNNGQTARQEAVADAV